MKEPIPDTLMRRPPRSKSPGAWWKLLWGAALVAAVALPSELALAQMYRWVDEQGRVHYSQDFESIPDRFRSQAAPIGGSPSPARPEPATPSPEATLDSPDSPENRLAAAQRYLAGVPVNDMLSDAILNMAQTVPEADRQQFTELLREMVGVDSLKGIMQDLAVKHFTVSELDALANFYGSPEGKSIMKKMGAYMGEAMPLIQAEVSRAANEIRGRAR